MLAEGIESAVVMAMSSLPASSSSANGTLM